MTHSSAPRRPGLGVTVGDPAGVGPELVAHALGKFAGAAELCVYGDVAAVERCAALPTGVTARPFATVSAMMAFSPP